ncbi:MAG: TIGR02391 family protein [Candidatus Methanoperedens sp.]|nr:TIGR02391 family protein [Candidatus Methanoperedens sp.]
MTKKNSKTKIKPRSKIFPEPIGKTIPISEDLNNIFIYFCNKSHILDSRLIPFLEKESEYEWTSRTVKTFRDVGIPEDKIYAFIKTQRILSEENIKYLNEEEIQEWNDAIDKFKRSKDKNKLIEKALNSLSRDKECPDLSKKELSALFDLRNFHPVLIDRCRDTFVSNHMKETVINGIIAVLNEIKEVTGRIDLDGADLINNVFSPDTPILATGSYELGDDTEQRGIHSLFLGFVYAIRNQFLHRDIYLENPLITIEYLSFFNFLLIILNGLKLKEEEESHKSSTDT